MKSFRIAREAFNCRLCLQHSNEYHAYEYHAYEYSLMNKSINKVLADP